MLGQRSLASRCMPRRSVRVPGPLFHNGPFALSTGGLTIGNHIVVFPRFDAEATLQAIDEHRGTFMFLVPTMMLRIWRLGDDVRNRYDVSSLETSGTSRHRAPTG
jgi:bile acid-coenzyme A ligase